MSSVPIVHGKLNLKGGSSAAHKKRKKASAQAAAQAAAELEQSPAAPGPASPPVKPMSDVALTKAELNFLLAQAKKEKELVKKQASKTHRERIEEFNKKLANLSEHYDIPKRVPLSAVALGGGVAAAYVNLGPFTAAILGGCLFLGALSVVPQLRTASAPAPAAAAHSPDATPGDAAAEERKQESSKGLERPGRDAMRKHVEQLQSALLASDSAAEQRQQQQKQGAEDHADHDVALVADEEMRAFEEEQRTLSRADTTRRRSIPHD
eukprot:m51a1_g3347 hypothetical protein (266) ;mRNA; r:406258-407519